MSDLNLQALLGQLRSEALPWPRRLDLCRALPGSLAASGRGNAEAREVVQLLAGDAKWEVRQAAVQLLDYVPEADFARLAGRLAKDQNDLVRVAARKAIERQRKSVQEQEQDKRASDVIEQQLRWLEERSGKALAKKARRLCEQHSALVVGSILHDLRSILTNLKSNCFLLIGQGSQGHSRRLGKNIERCFEYLEKTIQDMDRFSQLTPVERHPERLAEVIEAALEMARANLQEWQLQVVKVKVQVPPKLVVHIAKVPIVMAIANVIKNAYESFAVGASKLRPGKIGIRAALVDDHAEITVKDNGKGLSPEEKRALLFNIPGRRNKSKPHSTGYGLPTAQKYVAAHGGSLSFQSEENKGTLFTMVIPISPDND